MRCDGACKDPIRKLLADGSKMIANLSTRTFIRVLLHANFDNSPGSRQKKVMGDFVLVESHGGIAASFHLSFAAHLL